MNFENFLKNSQKIPVDHYPHQSQENVLLSVCVQTYQHVNYIRDCLDGILMQETDFSVEILLGEDASNDGTRQICIEYAQKYPDKIKLFLHHRENNISIEGTPTGRFNFVYNLYSARGKYLAICEGDDYWTDPKKLQKQVDFLEQHGEFVICAHNTFTLKDSLEASKSKTFPDGNFNSVVVNGLSQDTLSVVFRNEIDELPNWFFKCTVGDYPLYILLLEKGGKVKYMQDVMGCYRHHGGGMWSSLSSVEMCNRGVLAMEIINKGLNYKYKSLFKEAIKVNKGKFGLFSNTLVAVLKGETPLRFYIFKLKVKLKAKLNAYTNHSF